MFYQTIEECLQKHSPNVLVLSGVLQYLPEPFEWIAKFVALKMPYILIDRTSFINSDAILTIQNVPEEIYPASYPCWFFNENIFLNAFSSNYELVANFDSYADPVNNLNEKQLFWKGFYLKLKE